MKVCSPQLEKGHTRIANELLEAIIVYPFNAAELKIILAIIRKTYGWKQKAAYISYGLIAKSTGIDKRCIIRVLNKLIQDKVILKGKTRYSNILGLNKYYVQWKLWINLWMNLWINLGITLEDDGQQDTRVVDNSPLGSGQQSTINDGLESTILNKERNIYKENIKERADFLNFKEYLEEPIPIKKIIKSIIEIT